MNNESLSRKAHRSRYNKHCASLQPLRPLKIHQLCPYISVKITILEMRWAYERTLQVIGWKVLRRTAAVHLLCSSGSFANRWKESPDASRSYLSSQQQHRKAFFLVSRYTLCPAPRSSCPQWRHEMDYIMLISKRRFLPSFFVHHERRMQARYTSFESASKTEQMIQISFFGEVHL